MKKLRPEVPSMILAAMVATVAGRVLKAFSRTEGGKEPHTIGAEEGERNSPGYQENVKLRNNLVLHGFIGACHGKSLFLLRVPQVLLHIGFRLRFES